MTFFTADDFFSSAIMTNQQLADRCNAKLEREAKVVYVSDKILQGYTKTLHFVKPVDATHTGLLICVEEIEKKPCEHKVFFDGGKYSSSCAICGASMKPTGWEVLDEQR